MTKKYFDKVKELKKAKKSLPPQITEQKRIEEKLARIVAEQKNIMGIISDGIYMLDMSGNLVNWNKAAETVTGLSAKELTGKPIVELFVERDRVSVAEAIRKGLEEGTGEVTGSFLRKGRSPAIYQWSTVPLKDPQGKVIGLTGVGRDITECKQAEEALRESENKYRELFESSRDAIMMLAPPNWLFTAGNPATIKMFRAKDEKGFTSKGPGERSPKYQPDGQLSSEKSRKMIEEAMKIGSNFFEWTHKRLDGEEFTTNVLLTRIKLKGKESLQATVRDITEQKRMEEKLARIAAEQENIMGTISDGIYMLDMRGNLVNWNKAAETVTGLSAKELTGKPIVELFVERDRVSVAEAIRKGLKEGIGEVTGSFLRKGRSPAIYQWSTVPLKDPQGKVIGLTGVGLDITESKHVEESIKASLKEKDVLLQEIHHRVKNNLQVMSSLINIQARSIKDKDTIEMLSESRNRINAMALIHAQLYESKDLSEVNIKKFADALLRQLLQSYPVQGAMITPSIRVADFSLPISVATPVGLIVNELLTNTFKYAFTKRKEGKIEVRLDVSEKEKIELTVSDDGVGLPQEFDINTTKTLGLHLVKILVEDQLQGKLAVIREKGTTFRIEFEIDSV